MNNLMAVNLVKGRQAGSKELQKGIWRLEGMVENSAIRIFGCDLEPVFDSDASVACDDGFDNGGMTGFSCLSKAVELYNVL